MADTIRELIIRELSARGAVIRTVGGYATDIGETVLRARLRIDPDEAPCLVVIPQVEEAENKNGLSLHRMPVRVEGIAAFGAADPSAIGERIHGDLIKCFTSPDWDRRRASSSAFLAPYAESIVYQGGGIEAYPEAGDAVIGAAVKLLITYWTLTGDPYAQ